MPGVLSKPCQEIGRKAGRDVKIQASDYTEAMPTPLDCAIDLRAGADDDQVAACHELEVGQIADGISDDEGCKPGSPSSTPLPSWLGRSNIFQKHFVHADYKDESGGYSYVTDDSACIGEVDCSYEEDSIWNADWSTKRFQSVVEAVDVDAEYCLERNADCCVEQQQPDNIDYWDLVESSTVDTESCLDRSSDSCVELQPDNIHYLDCTELSTLRCGGPWLEHPQLLGLTDVPTWFARLQRRREQALRAGKTKLVRKIERDMNFELDKLRPKEPVVPQATCSSGPLDEGPSRVDDIYCKDWVDLVVAGPICG